MRAPLKGIMHLFPFGPLVKVPLYNIPLYMGTYTFRNTVGDQMWYTLGSLSKYRQWKYTKHENTCL